METTIYENLIYNENSLTEAFKNNLRIKPFRDVIFSSFQLEWLKIDTISHNDLTTQRKMSKYGRPDMVIENDQTEIIVEIKVSYGTNLTDNQPGSYINYLESVDKENKALIFIVPDNYQRWSYLESELKKNIKIDTKIISWNKLINKLEKKELASYNPLIFEFYSFLKNWFDFKKYTFNKTELKMIHSKENATAFIKLLRIIDNLEIEIKKRGFLVKASKDKYFSEYGFYILNSSQEYLLFIGLWADFWKETGKPIIITLENGKESFKDYFSSFYSDRLGTPHKFKWEANELEYDCFYFPENYYLEEKVLNKIIEPITAFLDKEEIKDYL